MKKVNVTALIATSPIKVEVEPEPHAQGAGQQHTGNG